MTCEEPVTFESSQWKRVSDDCKDLLRKLLTKAPEKRITLDEVVKHPWFGNMKGKFDPVK